ncbi:MAG: hypothetical protein P8Y75_01650 [Nitrospirota bacterium]
MSGPQSPAPFSVFSTMSAETPAVGEAAVAFSIEKAGQPDFTRVSSQLGLGVTEHLELDVNIPYQDDGASGLEDIAFSLKHRVLDEEDYGFSLAYLVAATLSSSTEQLSTDGALGAGVILTKRLGPVKGLVNFIYLEPWKSDLEEEIRASVGMDFAAAHNIDLLSEFLVKKSYFSGKVDRSELRIGYRIQSLEGFDTTLGAGIGINDRKPEYRLIVAVSLIFSPRQRYIEKVYEKGE